MKELTKTEINYLEQLIKSLTFEINKAKEIKTVSTSYVNEKLDKIFKIIN